MAKVIAFVKQVYSLHKDGWTETLGGLLLLIKNIHSMEEKGDSFGAIFMLRLVFIASSYLAEQVFNNTVQAFIDSKVQDAVDPKEKQKWLSQKSELSLKEVGISRAMKTWPKQLTGNNFVLGEGCLQSLKAITDKRNDIVHHLNESTLYSNSKPSKLAEQVVYTSIEACKVIERHFFPGKEFSYEEWLSLYPVDKAEYYKRI